MVLYYGSYRVLYLVLYLVPYGSPFFENPPFASDPEELRHRGSCLQHRPLRWAIGVAPRA